MSGKAWKTVCALSISVLVVALAISQEQPVESVDEVSEDIDLLQQLNTYGFTLEQLQEMIPVLQELAAKRQALEAYERSEEALKPMLALRDALIKGEPTADLETGMEVVWDRMQELEEACEEAIPPAMQKIAALLTDEQLTMLSAGDDWAYDEADRIFATLDTARDFDDKTFNAWRDRAGREVAFRAAGDSEEKAKQIETSVKQFLDKARRLKEDEYMDQYDELFDELHGLIVSAQPQPIREVVEAQAAEELEFVLRSERLLPLVEARVKALGGG